VVVADELGLADGDGEVLADGDGEVLDVAPSALAPTAWPVPPVVALVLVLADVVGVGLAEDDGLTDGLGLPEALVVGVVLGVVAAVVTVFGADSNACRNASCAVVPTSWETAVAFSCGTDTTIRSELCWTTLAPVKPDPSMRACMIDRAFVIAPWSTVVLPFGGSALRVICVPQDKSRPRPTLKLLCQWPGFAMLLPSTPASRTIRSTARTASSRPGREVVVLGGGTDVCLSLVG
jgi:hypothetical protein